jgi:hypothetical protein
MADAAESVTEIGSRATAAAKKAASKTTSRRKAPARKKAAARRKTAPGRKAAASKAKSEDFAARAQEISREAFLASLGFYGKAYDQMQEQFDQLQDAMEERRKNAGKLYRDLVKRGEKVEKQAKGRIESLDLPKFELESLTDREKLEAQLDKVKARLDGIAESFGLKSAA